MALLEEPSPWVDLPPEIRQLIIEEALRFDRPIKKLPVKKHVLQCLKDAAGLLKIDSRFALLFVNKQTFDEALPLLYKENIISTSHRTVHDLSMRATLNTEKIRGLVVRLPAASRNKHGKSCIFCTNPGILARCFDVVHFPNLKTVNILFDCDTSFRDSPISISKRIDLQSTGLDIEFTAVGCFRILGLRQGLDIIFEHQALAAAWRFISTLSREDTRKLRPQMPLNGDRVALIPLALEADGAGGYILDEICVLFLMRHGFNPLPIFRRIKHSDVQLDWLCANKQTSKVLEEITWCLERLPR